MNKTILVVDDQPPTRRFLRSVLEREGYRVIEAEDDASAWDAVRNQAAPICLAMIGNKLHLVSGMVTSAAAGAGQDMHLEVHTSSHDVFELPMSGTK